MSQHQREDGQVDDERCPRSPDQAHCVHWWDDENGLCCFCGPRPGLSRSGHAAIIGADYVVPHGAVAGDNGWPWSLHGFIGPWWAGDMR